MTTWSNIPSRRHLAAATIHECIPVLKVTQLLKRLLFRCRTTSQRVALKKTLCFSVLWKQGWCSFCSIVGCEDQFSDAIAQLIHMATVHYSCEHCAMPFRSRLYQQSHQEICGQVRKNVFVWKSNIDCVNLISLLRETLLFCSSRKRLLNENTGNKQLACSHHMRFALKFEFWSHKFLFRIPIGWREMQLSW